MAKTANKSPSSQKRRRNDEFSPQQIITIISIILLTVALTLVPMLGFDYFFMIAGVACIGLIYAFTYKQVYEFVDFYQTARQDIMEQPELNTIAGITASTQEETIVPEAANDSADEEKDSA